MLELKKLAEAMEEINTWYTPNLSDKLLQIDVKWDDWKLKLILEILALNKSLWLSLHVNLRWREFSVNRLTELFSDCVNYRNNVNMVAWKMSEALALTVSWLAANNTSTHFDYTVIVDIYNWDKEYTAFLAQNEINLALVNSWTYTGKSGTKYEGKGFRDALKMKGDDVMDIIEWNLKEFWEDVTKAFNFAIDKENKALINKNFKSVRMAAISIFKWILTNEPSDFTEFVLKQPKKFLIEDDQWNEIGFRIIDDKWEVTKEEIAEWYESYTEENEAWFEVIKYRKEVENKK